MGKNKSFRIFTIILALFISCLFSASIAGIVYNESIEPMVGVGVRLEKGGFVYGEKITNSSGYSFSYVPSGEYTIVASFLEGEKELRSSARINLSESDSLTIDFVLMEELGVEMPDILTIPEEKEFEQPVPETSWVYFGFIIGVGLVIIFFVYRLLNTKGKEMEKIREEIEKIREERAKETPMKYLTDEEKVYQIIQRRREIPQKEIVIETGYSKAKVSLIVDKLEMTGRIKREKKGREKIIKFIG